MNAFFHLIKNKSYYLMGDVMTYTVKAGDTLWGISNQFGVSVTELARLNNVNANTLKIGQVLNIPSDTGTNPSNMFMYTVKKGDSLYSIAKKYNTTVKDIIDINSLKDTSLSIGQQLRIPEKYTEGELIVPNYINYTVKKGDSLYKIANEFNVSSNIIMEDNGLTNSNLAIGQNLKIRVIDDNNVVVLECFGDDYDPPSQDISTTTYTVKKGDSLYSIANRFNTSVSDITRLNNLSSNILTVGQQLMIPNSINNSSTTYTVKKGDSLYSIANRFNTTVNSIKNKNNLTTNNLSIGQVLII